MPPLRHEGRRDPESGGRRRPLRRQPAVLRRREDLGGESADRRQAARARALLSAEKFTHSYMHCWRHRTPIIYRATTQWFAGMDDVPGWNGMKPERTLRETALAGIDGDAVLPGVGQGAALRDDREPARLDALAPAAVGRADAVLHPQGDRCAASAHARAAGAGRAARGEGRHRGVADARRRAISAPTISTDYVKIKDTLDVWFDSGSHAPDRDGRPGRARSAGAGSHRGDDRAFPRISTSKARTSIAAGSIRRCSCRAC